MMKITIELMRRKGKEAIMLVDRIEEQMIVVVVFSFLFFSLLFCAFRKFDVDIYADVVPIDDDVSSVTRRIKQFKWFVNVIDIVKISLSFPLKSFEKIWSFGFYLNLRTTPCENCNDGVNPVILLVFS